MEVDSTEIRVVERLDSRRLEMELRLWLLRELARIPELTSTSPSFLLLLHLFFFLPSFLLSPTDTPCLLDCYDIPRGVRLISGHPLTVDRPRMEVRMIVSSPCPVNPYVDKQEPSLITDSVS